MYPVEGPYNYAVMFKKGSRRFQFNLCVRRIPDSEFLALDRVSQRTFRTQEDDSVITDTMRAEEEQAVGQMFDKHVTSVNGKETTPELLAKVPMEVKRTLILNCYGMVQADQGPLEEVFDLDAIAGGGETEVKLVHVVNDSEERLTHWMREPSEEDGITFRRAHGRLRLLPGRRRAEYSTVERFDVYPELYDKLLVRVYGYTQNGAPMEPGNGCAKQIPYLHKKVVIGALFGRAQQGEPGEAKPRPDSGKPSEPR